MSKSAGKERYCLVMAGGKGTRLWPESTSQQPKQYLALMDGESLLLHTLKRFAELTPLENRFVVTLKEQARQADLASKGMLKRDALILEPQGQNTGPCIFLALVHLLAKGASESAVVAVVPADHAIPEEKLFEQTLDAAYTEASKGKSIVTIGVKPSSPHTGFGYIERGKKVGKGPYQVKAFKEKPDLKKAKEYVKSGDYYWNAGMFVGSIAAFLAEFKTHAPDIYKYLHELKENLKNAPKLLQTYQKMPAISFDYAVCEKSKNMMVIPALFQWNDLGSWAALEAVAPKEEDNFWIHNVSAQSDFLVQEAKGNIVYAPNQFVALLGVEDLVIVSNKNVLLIMPKEKSEKVKDIVNALAKNPKTENLI